jgi:hypothetical protein
MNLSRIEHSAEKYKTMTSDRYEELIRREYSELKKAWLSENGVIIPRKMNIHLACRNCTGHCLFCVQGGVKHTELALASPERTQDFLQRILRLRDEDSYVSELHFDGDSADPIMRNTADVFTMAVDTIRQVEKDDGCKRRNNIINKRTN